MPKPSKQTAFTRALHEIHSDGVCTTREMAQAADCSERHMRHVVSICDPTQISLEKAERLSAWLVDTFGETRQLDGLLGLRGATHLRPEDVEGDDCLLEELALISKHLSRADDAIKDDDPEMARKEVERAFEELRRAHEDARSIDT